MYLPTDDMAIPTAEQTYHNGESKSIVHHKQHVLPTSLSGYTMLKFIVEKKFIATNS